MPFGIPEPNVGQNSGDKQAEVQAQLQSAKLRLQQYQEWLDGQSGVQRLRRSNPSHPILIARNTITILTIIALFVLVTSVILPLVDGTYARQLANLDSTFGMSFTGASLAILVLTIFIWFALGVAASGFTQDLPLSPGESAGLARIKLQIESLEARLVEMRGERGDVEQSPSANPRLDLSIGQPSPSRVQRISQDLARLGSPPDDDDDHDDEWDPEPTIPRLQYSSVDGESSEDDSADTSYYLLETIQPQASGTEAHRADNNAVDEPGAPEPSTVPNSPMDDFINEQDLTVEVTDDPSGAWDKSAPNRIGSSDVYQYTEVLDDLGDEYADLSPDPPTEDLENLWSHIQEAWLRNAMAQAERLADRLPETAHIEISSEEYTPFKLVIERASPNSTVRTMMLFIDFLAAIPTPPKAAIELIGIPQANRDFHKKVQSALQPSFPGKATVTHSANRVDIVLDDAYSGWSNYPHLPVDE